MNFPNAGHWKNHRKRTKDLERSEDQATQGRRGGGGGDATKNVVDVRGLSTWLKHSQRVET